ncbi:protein flightless-1-like, partial [Rhagoletis pomonella]|uniref:protein flightless-1-like n=1 Tax=Rhagoletis pomonella TaxID=28610 RepID=UPI00177EB683
MSPTAASSLKRGSSKGSPPNKTVKLDETYGYNESYFAAAASDDDRNNSCEQSSMNVGVCFGSHIQQCVLIFTANICSEKFAVRRHCVSAVTEVEKKLSKRIDEILLLTTTLKETSTRIDVLEERVQKAVAEIACISALEERIHINEYLKCLTDDESEEFLELFDTEVTYIEGGRTATGFYTVEDMLYTKRLYRVHAAGSSVHLEPVAVHFDSLDPRYAFMLDCGITLYIWLGCASKNTLNSKTRLMAEKINKTERKNKCEIILEMQGEENEDFWKNFGADPQAISKHKIPQHVSNDFVPSTPRLYQVQLGMGYLELPQVEFPDQKLVHTLLNSKNVYILDCYTDLFVWFGKKSTRLVRAAAIKLSRELFRMINRPDFAVVTRLQEGTESQIFKSKFTGWDEVMAVDFTRTANSVAKTGADLTKWARKQETRADLAALFMPRQNSMPLSEAEQLEEDWNYDLEAMEAFVLEGKKFVRLPEDELGNFYTGECYVFLCRYCIPIEEEEVDVDDIKHSDDEIQCVVYFWQGRNASNMGWLTFTFTLQKKFKAMFGEELEVVRIHQQQENLKFMAHFKRKFIIHTGKRKDKSTLKPAVEFFHLRSNGGALCTRLIQIQPDAANLNSAFCYILYVPFDTEDELQSGIVYVWMGLKSSTEECKLIQEIAEKMFNNPWVSLQVRTCIYFENKLQLCNRCL